MAATGKRFKAEQIVNLLREIDVMTANSKSLLEACQQVGINYKSYYRWCKICGGLKVDQARKFKEIETESARLKKSVAELSLREAILKEVLPGKLLSPARHKAAAKMLMERYRASERKACACGR
jgi:putative transposase